MAAVADGDSVIMFGGVSVPVRFIPGCLRVFTMQSVGKLERATLPSLMGYSITDFQGLYYLPFAPSREAIMVITEGDSTCSLKWHDTDSAEVRNWLKAAATAG